MRVEMRGICSPFCWILVATLIAGAACPVYAGTVTISGRVTEHLTGNPVEGVRVSFSYQSSPFGTTEIGFTTTGGDGLYQWSGTCPSIYDCYIGIDDERYLPAGARFNNSVPTVTQDFDLITPATISGDIHIDGAIPADAIGISISYLDDWGEWAYANAEQQENDGHYVLSRVPPGFYYRVCAGSLEQDTIRQCFDHHDQGSLATDPPYDFVTVGEDEQRGGIDFDLTRGGGFRGTVYDAYAGVPLSNQNATLTLYSASGDYLRSLEIFLDDQGAYEISGLPDGAYYLRIDVAGSFWDAVQIYPNLPCTSENCPPPTDGELLTIAGAQILPGLDFIVHPSVVISGRVTDANTGVGIADAMISVRYSLFWYHIADTDATGNYTLYAFADQGPVSLLAFGAPIPFLDMVYPDIACVQGRDCNGQAQSIEVHEGDVLNGIDFPLELGATVSGSVINSVTGAPVQADIFIYDGQYRKLWSTSTEEGNFAFPPVLPGTYYALAMGFDEFSGCQFYDDQPCGTGNPVPPDVDPTPIVLAPGDLRTGIDFRLYVERIFANGFEY